MDTDIQTLDTICGFVVVTVLGAEYSANKRGGGTEPTRLDGRSSTTWSEV